MLNFILQFQHDRVRVIYKYALDNLPKDRTHEIYKAYTIHEKKYGDRSGKFYYLRMCYKSSRGFSVLFYEFILNMLMNNLPSVIYLNFTCI